MSKKYATAKDGEWVQPRRKNFRLECCDCGLVHTLNFRVVKNEIGQNKIQFQAFRNRRATGQVRRHKKNGK